MDLTVAITGATSGIGRAVAEAFADEGAFVAVSGRDGDAVDRTVAALNEGRGGDGDAADADGQHDETDTDSEHDGNDAAGAAWGERVDVRDEFDLERFFQRAAREAGPIDVVFANAAVFHGGPGENPTDETTYADYDDTMRTNARGVFATLAEAVPHLADNARMIVPSGSVAHESKAGMGAYAVSKAAAEAVARGFAADLDATVGVVDPGLVATDLTGMERARDPESVAPLFVWAATEAPPRNSTPIESAYASGNRRPGSRTDPATFIMYRGQTPRVRPLRRAGERGCAVRSRAAPEPTRRARTRHAPPVRPHKRDTRLPTSTLISPGSAASDATASMNAVR